MAWPSSADSSLDLARGPTAQVAVAFSAGPYLVPAPHHALVEPRLAPGPASSVLSGTLRQEPEPYLREGAVWLELLGGAVSTGA